MHSIASGTQGSVLTISNGNSRNNGSNRSNSDNNFSDISYFFLMFTTFIICFFFLLKKSTLNLNVEYYFKLFLIKVWCQSLFP